MDLKDSSLFQNRCYINGAWVNADTGHTVDVTNPATGMSIGTTPSLSANEVALAIDAANAALPRWRSTDAKTRANIMRKWFELCIANQDELGRILTTEQGKPLAARMRGPCRARHLRQRHERIFLKACSADRLI